MGRRAGQGDPRRERDAREPRGEGRGRRHRSRAALRPPGGAGEPGQPADLVGALTPMAFVLGIDASTTATKAVLVDETGTVAGIAAAEYGFEQPHPVWSEQDPRLWSEGAASSIRRVLAETGTDAADVQAVGLTGQMHGLVLLDAAGEVLRPAILWNDQRTGAECDAIRAAVGPRRLVGITGNDAL